MRYWITEIQALDPITKELKRYAGVTVKAINKELAQQFCNENGLGYCKVVGQLIMVVPCKKDSYTPDWDKKIDYDIIEQN